MEEMDEAEDVEKMDEAEDMEEGKKEEMMEVDLEELLAELESEEMEEGENLYEAEEEGEEEGEEEEGEEEGDMEMEDLSDDEIKEMIEDVIAQMIKDGELEAGPEFGGEEEGEEMETEEEEEVDLDELLAEEKEVKEALGYDAYASAAEVIGGISAVLGALGIGAAFNWKDEIKAAAEKGKEALATKAKEISTKLFGGKKMEEASKEDLEEAYSTIETLKSELHEINLLNAKLLYTNKIFRNKSLTESQKVKVLTAFDKATTKKEIELVYIKKDLIC